MAERHSSENGRHGGPGLPMLYGVLGAVGFAMAAITILIAGQLSVGPLGAGGVDGSQSATTYGVLAKRAMR